MKHCVDSGDAFTDTVLNGLLLLDFDQNSLPDFFPLFDISRSKLPQMFLVYNFYNYTLMYLFT